MELSFKDLQKREVINVVDGRSFGKITDLQLQFPQGKLVGIVVPGRKDGWFVRLFTKNKIYIPEQNIVKIGGDVILVNISCGETCAPSASVTPPKPKKKPHCPPPCPPSPQPRQAQYNEDYSSFEQNLYQDLNDGEDF